MNIEAKISTAFKPFLAESGPNDKRDAIVIYKAPMTDGPRVRGRLRDLKKRLDRVKSNAAPVQAKLFEDYRKASVKRLTIHACVENSDVDMLTLTRIPQLRNIKLL